MSIRSSCAEGICNVQIDRPEKKNALTGEMYCELARVFAEADRDPSIRALLLTGQPSIFCAGNDLADFVEVPPSLEEAPPGRMMRAVTGFGKPIVAAVQGPAIGVGATILLHCDFVYLAGEAQLVFPFVSLGLVPEFGSSLLLAQRIGHLRAARALLLGEAIPALDAVQLGLATAVLPATEILAHAQGIARRFTELSADAVRHTKELMQAGNRGATAHAMSAEGAAFIERLKSAEVQARLQAFLQRRRANEAAVRP